MKPETYRHRYVIGFKPSVEAKMNQLCSREGLTKSQLIEWLIMKHKEK